MPVSQKTHERVAPEDPDEPWSPRTGWRDREDRPRDYKERGEAEIRSAHPRQRTVTVRRRQADGTYAETVYGSGSVPVRLLPGVTIDLNELFAEL
jgi:Uma2 family endonuclease